MPVSLKRVLAAINLTGFMPRFSRSTYAVKSQVLEVCAPSFEKPDEKRVCLGRVDADAPAVEPQEHVSCEERHPLIAIDERMVHQERFKRGLPPSG